MPRHKLELTSNIINCECFSKKEDKASFDFWGVSLFVTWHAFVNTFWVDYRIQRTKLPFDDVGCLPNERLGKVAITPFIVVQKI